MLVCIWWNLEYFPEWKQPAAAAASELERDPATRPGHAWSIPRIGVGPVTHVWVQQ